MENTSKTSLTSIISHFKAIKSRTSTFPKVQEKSGIKTVPSFLQCQALKSGKTHFKYVKIQSQILPHALHVNLALQSSPGWLLPRLKAPKTWSYWKRKCLASPSHIERHHPCQLRQSFGGKLQRNSEVKGTTTAQVP